MLKKNMKKSLDERIKETDNKAVAFLLTAVVLVITTVIIAATTNGLWVVLAIITGVAAVCSFVSFAIAANKYNELTEHRKKIRQFQSKHEPFACDLDEVYAHEVAMEEDPGSVVSYRTSSVCEAAIECPFASRIVELEIKQGKG